MMDISDMIDPTKRPMLTATERKAVDNLASVMLSSHAAPTFTVVLAGENIVPLAMVMRAGLEALK